MIRSPQALTTYSELIQGFIVSERPGREADFLRDVSGWLKEGKIRYKEDVVEGLENAPRAFLGLFRGENFGKNSLSGWATTRRGREGD